MKSLLLFDLYNYQYLFIVLMINRISDNLSRDKMSLLKVKVI